MHRAHTHCVCEFRKFSRCKFFFRFAHHRHTHLISAHTHISHVAALIVIESDIKYTIEIQTQLTKHNTYHHERNTHFIYDENLSIHSWQKKERKITIYAQTVDVNLMENAAASKCSWLHGKLF